MNIKGYSNNICAGIVGFTSDTKIKDIIKVAEGLSKLKNFKRVMIRRTSNYCWGIDVIFKRKETSKTEPVSGEVISKIKKISPKVKIKQGFFSGEIIQIKPKRI